MALHPSFGAGETEPSSLQPRRFAPSVLSPPGVGDGPRVSYQCSWCKKPLPEGTRRHARFCPDQQVCRQAAFRLRRRAGALSAAERPGRFCYADPPYPGKAFYYRDQPSYGGEVDHAELVERLEAGGFDGWALSTSGEALQDVLALCPRGVAVRPWCKPIPPDPRAYGPTCRSEFLIVRGGRAKPGARVRDFLVAQPARLSGEQPLIGRKPLAFCAFLFEQLGMVPGDELVDLYPGTGIVSRAWGELCAASPA